MHRRDDSKRSFTVTYHTLTVTVVRISNLYQACYRFVLPSKTARTFHLGSGRRFLLFTEAQIQCSSLITDIKPVSTNPSCRAGGRGYGLLSIAPRGSEWGSGDWTVAPPNFFNEMSHASCTVDPPRTHCALATRSAGCQKFRWNAMAQQQSFYVRAPGSPRCRIGKASR